MEIAICAAISKDGFIATNDGDSDWVKDDEIFDKACSDYGCIALGNITFEQYEGELYPIKGIQNIILTTEPKESKYKNVHFVGSVDQAVTKAMQLGFKKLLVVGGAKTNETFIKSNMVKKVFIDEHEVTLGGGLKPFGDFSGKVKLKLISSKSYPEFVHKEYEVTK